MIQSAFNKSFYFYPFTFHNSNHFIIILLLGINLYSPSNRKIDFNHNPLLTESSNFYLSDYKMTSNYKVYS